MSITWLPHLKINCVDNKYNQSQPKIFCYCDMWRGYIPTVVNENRKFSSKDLIKILSLFQSHQLMMQVNLC